VPHLYRYPCPRPSPHFRGDDAAAPPVYVWLFFDCRDEFKPGKRGGRAPTCAGMPALKVQRSRDLRRAVWDECGAVVVCGSSPDEAAAEEGERETMRRFSRTRVESIAG
jgi:hypothetical protein